MTDIRDLFEYDRGDWWRRLDWVPVVDVDLGGGYEWDEFHAWYSVSERVYYWGSGSGCSCDSFTDNFHSVGDFANGRGRAEVMAALTSYFADHYTPYPQEAVRALYTVNAFNPSQRGLT